MTAAATRAPDAVDFIDVGAGLSAEERLVRDTVRAYVRARVLPNVGDWFEHGTLPRELGVELGRLGLLGMHLDGYECPGASAVAYGLACLELEAGDSGVRSFASVQGSLAMYAIYRWGDEAQKRTWLPAMARGERIGCFGLTEPDFGSNPAGMRTYARRDGSDWILDGTKMWITNGSIADLAIVWAQTESGIRGFIVPRDAKGFRASDIHRKLSLRASVTSELVMSDCRLPADALLPLAGLTGARSLACLNEARYGIVWGSMGAARSCYETALEYSKTRVQFDRAIGAYQMTQAKLVNMLLELNKGTLLALHVGRAKDAGTLHSGGGEFRQTQQRAAKRSEIAREARTVLRR